MPPAELFETFESMFIPAPELTAWANEMFIDDDALMQSGEHEHLQQAHVAFVWTNEANERRGRTILGTCQMLPPSGDKWSVGRACAQLRGWFGEMPDFLIILYAPAALEMSDRQFLALTDHELSHAGQRHDQHGSPMFSKETGRPLWTMKGHDVEEFVGVVRRFGATSPEIQAMVDAVNAGSVITDEQVSLACGYCAR